MSISPFPPASAVSRSERTVFITSTQSWTAPADVTSVDILLVGGGGGAGGNAGTATGSGGGGGGGVLQDSVPVTPSTAYTITIGAGGAGGTSAPGHGGDGSSSTFGSLRTCYGGGRGWAGNYSNNGAEAGGVTANVPVASLGGVGSAGSTAAGGSGGGADGFTATYVAGTDVFVSQRRPASVQGMESSRWGQDFSGGRGINGYGSGGGAGNSNNWVIQGGLGAGRGGAYTYTAAGASGDANRGGGGGGSYGANVGGNGGSGICIIKYWSAL